MGTNSSGDISSCNDMFAHAWNLVFILLVGATYYMIT
jgi:hypothetical protein